VWRVYPIPAFLLFLHSFLNLQVCGAGRGLGSSEASVAATWPTSLSLSLSLSFLFVVFSFSLLPRRKRNSSFSLIEPVVLNDGRPLLRHTRTGETGPLFPEPTGQMHLGKLSPGSVFYTHESLCARHSFSFFFLRCFSFSAVGNVDDDTQRVYLFHVCQECIAIKGALPQK